MLEIETADPAMKDWIPPAAAAAQAAPWPRPETRRGRQRPARGAVILGLGGYLPERVVTNAELLKHFPDISENTSSR